MRKFKRAWVGFQLASLREKHLCEEWPEQGQIGEGRTSGHVGTQSRVAGVKGRQGTETLKEEQGKVWHQSKLLSANECIRHREPTGVGQLRSGLGTTPIWAWEE